MLRIRSLTPPVVGVAVALAATRASAQTEQEMAARAQLLEQAQAARTAGDHARALDAATRAGRIRMTPSVRLFIAEENESAGHLAEAMSSADLCVREATRDATLRNRDAILGSCNEIAGRLRGRVGQVIVNFNGSTPPGLRVTVAGAELSDALFGVAYMVNPGTVPIDAQAPGYAPFHRDVPVAAGNTVNVGIALRAGGGTSSATVSTSVSTDAGRGGGPGVGPWIVMGVGAAALGTSLVLFLLRNDAIGDCTTQNDAMGDFLSCPSQASIDRAHAAPGLNLGTNITLIGGAALVVGGGLWFLLGGGLSGGGARGHAALDVAPDPAGGVRLNLRGSF
jgi:hypothetical protein